MSYPPNSAPGGQGAPSFKTNVNRAKTKRWVEAKSYTYDGDDWGEADEYDEYGGYDEPPPPPKPTGLRQQGQSARPINQSPYGSPTDPTQRPMDNRQMYGSGGTPQQHGQRRSHAKRRNDHSTTNPQPRVNTGPGRSNSFDRGDEKRAFSAGGFQQDPSIRQFDPNQMRPVQPEASRPYPDQQNRFAEEPIQEMDRQQRQPLHRREPSYPDQQPRLPSMGSRTQSMTSNTSATDIHSRRDFTPSALPPPLHPKSSPSTDRRMSPTHPPRKSSLSQMHQPSFPPSQNSVPVAAEPASRSRTSSNADKPLPFVRPADIYRRMQEDRQSQESSRPSMDSMALERDANKSDPSEPIVSPTPSHVPDQIEAREHGRTMVPQLYPVAERRDNQAPHRQYELTKPSSQESAPVQPRAAPSAAQSTLSPVLPEVARMSSFGDSFFKPNGIQEPSLQAMLSSTEAPPTTDEGPIMDGSSGGLQHQPSSGFRSVVNQAFDIRDDQIPPTPTSTAGSGVQRSTSGGTSVISPIISRGPSTTTPYANTSNVEARARTPSLPEEGEGVATRPMSSGSVTTPKQTFGRPLSQATSLELGESSPPSTFIPGHRRDFSTPSPGNSPARTPALEANKQLRQPQEAELAISTPTEPSFPLQHGETIRRESNGSSIGSANESRKRSDSPSKSRVRDLAGKFESATSSRRGSETSLRGGTGASSPQRLDMPAPGRPLADRMESFRPHLPGGWDSFISNAPTAEPDHVGLENEDESGFLPRSRNTSRPRSLSPTKQDTQSDHIKSSLAFASAEAPSEQATPLARPPLSTLNTDSHSQYESDRLRREIERSLTPNPTNEPTTAESLSPYQDESQGGVEGPREVPSHESMVLPREYDSYWDGSHSTRSNSELIPESKPSTTQEFSGPIVDENIVASPNNNILSPRLQRLVSEPRVEEQRPPAPGHRFSWEQAPVVPGPVEAIRQPTEPDHGVQDVVVPPGTQDEDVARDRGTSPKTPPDDFDIVQPRLEGTRVQAHEYPFEPQSMNGGSGSLKAPPSDDSIKIDETVPEPAYNEMYSPPGQAANLPIISPPSASQSKIPAFREISALKTPAERIKGYNDAREQFANQDTGMAHWLAMTVTEHPEHADVLSSVGRPPAAMMGRIPSSSRLLSGLRSTGPRSDMSEGAGHGQGSYPSSGSSKLATQQVQAKGKDLLHSAGVFGGKANVAAKGLFSKGRSRFRGTDKDPTPPLSPALMPRGTQPQAQPPVDVRNAESDITTSRSLDQGAFLDRPLSYGERVDHPEPWDDAQNYDQAKTIPHEHSNHGDHTGPIPPNVPTSPTRNDSLALTGLPPAETEVEDTVQVTPVHSITNASSSHDQTQPAEAPTSYIPDTATDGTRTPTQSFPREQVRSSPFAAKRTSLQDHFASQAESLRDVIGTPTRHEPSPPRASPTPLSLPRSRFSAETADRDRTVSRSQPEGQNTHQPETERYSEDSNRTFHTAENSIDSGPESRQPQEEVETPKAEKLYPFIHQDLPRRAPSDFGQSQHAASDPSRDFSVAPDRPAQTPSSRDTEHDLRREPSLDNVSDVALSDQPPSPISPQQPYIQEPAGRQDRQGPIYYGPDHDFGLTSHDHAPPTRLETPRQHSRGPSLENHPAFRREPSPVRRSNDISALGTYRHPQAAESLPRSNDARADMAPTQSETPAISAKRASRNSGFFKAIKPTGVIADSGNVASEQTKANPARVSTDGQQKAKRNSLFGARNGEKTNGKEQSEKGSPAPTSRIDNLRQAPPATPEKKGNSSPSSGTSSSLRSKLQRTSTSGNKEKDSGKKKRFSALGSLFGSRSRKAQPPPPQSKQPQQVTFYHFDESRQQKSEQRPQEKTQKRPDIPNNRTSSQQTRNPQPQQHRTSTQGPVHEYYAPGQSDQKAQRHHEITLDNAANARSQASTPAWSQTAQRVSQIQQPSANEPPAYAQDSDLRQRVTALPESSRARASRTSAVVTGKTSDESRSRSSIWSRNRKSEVPLSKPHDRNSSGSSWTMAGQNQARQSTHSHSVSQPTQPALASRPDATPTHDSQGRVLTYSQFDGSNITYPPPQQHAANPSGLPGQPTQQQPQNVVTFQQFPPNQATAADAPPPPPPKDDWHVARPRQSTVPQPNKPPAPVEQQQPSNSRSSYTHQPATSHQPSRASRQSFNPQPSNMYNQQPTTNYQPNIPSQPSSYMEQQQAPPHSRAVSHSSQNIANYQPNISPQPSPYTEQPPPPSSQTRTVSHASQNQRQSLPPLQTEVPTRRSGAFSPEKTSAESRKARQRELEMGATPVSATKSSAQAPKPAEPAMKEERNEEPIVMSSSSYPGMEWTPDRWEDD